MADCPPIDANSTWPAFLDWLDSDSERAGLCFYSFAVQLLTVCPPAVVSKMPSDERADLYHDIATDCIVDGFRVLRMYRDRGKPFAAWFYIIARNRMLDRIRTARAAPASPRTDPPGPVPHPEEDHERRAALEAVEECLSKLSENCQILLRYASEEYSIPEILAARLLAKHDNKKVSDAIRYCQKRLRECVKSKGVEISRILKG